MDEKYLQTLEFPKILSRLADHTDFSAGREMALALRPTTDLEQARAWQQETTEARYLMDTRGLVGMGGARDVRPRVEAAVRGAVLLPQELLTIAETLSSGRRLKHSLLKAAEKLPRLAAIARSIEECPAAVNEIHRCVNDQGEVVDSASPKLARLRHDLKLAHERLMERLNRILGSSNNAAYLQEALITQRHGRYVVPLRSEFKGRIPGIVHDRSGSGATLFIEPLAAVELTNRWRELQLEEEQEVQRILAHLSALVADDAHAIEATVDALARLDLVFARARYAESQRAVEAQLLPFRAAPPAGSPAQHSGAVLRLMRARHPLLDAATVVPVDVYLGDSYYMVVITGPNTGGKTVALKTVGLLTLMAQAGLHIPAREDSTLSVFESVHADIGDEQSIEQSLSTFSGHLTNIIRILKQADERSLVLIDELGAGTDPVEGAALARAILSHLLQRGVTTFVATHYPDLKAFAHTTPGVENASVEFDIETLSPTYELTIGLPGRSNAFSIASRLGLPPEIVQQARGYVSAEGLSAEDWLAEVKALRDATARMHDEALAVRRRAETAARELESRLAHIEAERQAVVETARVEAREELGQLRQEMRRLRHQMSAVIQDRTALAELESQAEALEKKSAPPPPPLRPRILPRRPLQAGDTVLIGGLGVDGEVREVSGESIDVQVGHFRVRVRPEDVELREQSLQLEKGQSSSDSQRVSLPPAPSPGIELHLRGYRVADALPRLETYLNDAFLAGLPWVRIVHGKGSGVLRQAVHEVLPHHALVTSFRIGQEGEGGEGVTIVRLASR